MLIFCLESKGKTFYKNMLMLPEQDREETSEDYSRLERIKRVKKAEGK